MESPAAWSDPKRKWRSGGVSDELLLRSAVRVSPAGCRARHPSATSRVDAATREAVEVDSEYFVAPQTPNA